MAPWILLAASVLLNAVIILYARSSVIDAKAAIAEAAAIKNVYGRVLGRLERKFGEKRVGRVARDVLRQVTDEVKAKELGSV